MKFIYLIIVRQWVSWL